VCMCVREHVAVHTLVLVFGLTPLFTWVCMQAREVWFSLVVFVV